MRLRTGSWFVAAGLAAGVSLSSAFAATGPEEQAAKVSSLSGAYLAARIADSDNDLPAAIAYYRRAMVFDPDNQGVQQSLMLGLISQGDFDEALPLAEKLKEAPEVERFSRVALAVDAFRKKDFSNAEYLLKLALGSDLDRLITGIMTGWAKQGGGDSAGALAAIDALEGPEWYELFLSYHRALIAEQAGNDSVARKAYDETAENLSAGGAAPETYLRALEAYAGYLVRKDDRKGALAVLDKADEFAPGRLTVQVLRNQIDKGAKAPAIVANAQEGAAEILLNLATALNRSGGESFVRLYLQYANALRPRSDAILIQLAGVAEQQRDAETAIAEYEKIPDSSPMKAVAELQLGLNLADLERYDEAIEHLKSSLAEDPDDMRAYQALGGVYARQENYRAAADLFDVAVSRIDEPERTDWNVFYQRGIAYERLKEWDKAEPNFRKALELFPDQPQVLNYLGYSWVDMNINLEEGLDLIRRAVELRPSDGYIVDSLGWAYYKLGRFDEAVSELQRAVGLMPADPVLNDHLGDAYWRVGRKLEATFQWRHTLQLEPDDKVKADAENKLKQGLGPVEERAASETVEAPETAAATVVPVPDLPEVTETGAQAVPEPVVIEPAAAERRTHVVAPGQSLWSIAVEKLGDGHRYREILGLNPSLRGDPGRIMPGQELVLPPEN